MALFEKKEKTNKSTNDTSKNSEPQTRKEKKEQLRQIRTAQAVIGYQQMLNNGICYLGEDMYSKAVRFKDINYQIAPDDVKMTLIRRYKALLNSMGNELDVSMVINNRIINREEFEQKILMKHHGDGLDVIRGEMNQHLINNMHRGNNSIVSDKMFVFSCKERNYLEAEKTLNNMEKDFLNQLYDLGCEPEPMDGEDRLETLHSILKPTSVFTFSYEDMTAGASTKDAITPYSFSFKKDYFEMGDRFCRVMVLSTYPTWFNDRLIYELTQLESNLLMTFHMQIRTKEDALADINKTSAMVDIQVQDENRKSMKNMDFSGTLPPNLAAHVENVREWRSAIEKGDERMFQTQMLVMINASSKDEMEQITKDVERIGKRNSCEFIPMEYEQELGFNCALPLGRPKEGLGRNLLTDNCANIMPFTSQELLDEEAPTFYGVNTTTNNMILCNRKTLPNANGFILGKSGSGKSFKVKEEFTWTFLNDDKADVIIIDPQGEYARVAESLNHYSNVPQCAVLEVSNTSELFFNPFDGDITQPDFTRRKAEFIQILMAEMIGNGFLTAEQKSITDQVVYQIYQNYESALAKKDYENVEVPTLRTFYDILGTYDNAVALNMYRSLWTYVEGSYDLFAHQSNVDANARMLVYDISQLGETIRTLGLKVVLENVREQIIRNHAHGKRTYIYIDEIYLLLKDEYSENFLYEFWKWVRKFGGACTGMTQNVSDLLRSQKGSAMLSNSEFYIILSQDQLDLSQLKSLLSLSEEQVRYVQTARKGSGLIRFGNTIIPFSDDFPKTTICYSMWNTDPQKLQNQKTAEMEKRKQEALAYQQRQKDFSISFKQEFQEEQEKTPKQELSYKAPNALNPDEY